MQEFCSIFSGKIKHVPRADRSDHQGFNTQSQIVWRAGWRCKIEDIIDWAGIEAQADIFFEKLESRFGIEMSNILSESCAEIIKTNHEMSVGEKSVGKMGTQKTSSSGDGNAHQLFTVSLDMELTRKAAPRRP